jgi:hypothetical protein
MDVQRFAHTHKNYLVIVCDPKDDTIFVSYRDKQVAGMIKSMDGKNHKVIKNLIKHSTFDREIDRFLGGIIDVLKTPLKSASDFLKFLDGALFNISQSLKKEKK